jgi:hypothetical protein
LTTDEFKALGDGAGVPLVGFVSLELALGVLLNPGRIDHTDLMLVIVQIRGQRIAVPSG